MLNGPFQWPGEAAREQPACENGKAMSFAKLKLFGFTQKPPLMWGPRFRGFLEWGYPKIGCFIRGHLT